MRPGVADGGQGDAGPLPSAQAPRESELKLGVDAARGKVAPEPAQQGGGRGGRSGQRAGHCKVQHLDEGCWIASLELVRVGAVARELLEHEGEGAHVVGELVRVVLVDDLDPDARCPQHLRMHKHQERIRVQVFLDSRGPALSSHQDSPPPPPPPLPPTQHPRRGVLGSSNSRGGSSAPPRPWARAGP